MNATAQLASDQADYEQAMMAEEAAAEMAAEATEEARAEEAAREAAEEAATAAQPWPMNDLERGYIEDRLWPLRRGGESYGAVLDRLLRERREFRKRLEESGVMVECDGEMLTDLDPDETLSEEDDLRAEYFGDDDMDGDAASALESVYGPND